MSLHVLDHCGDRLADGYLVAAHPMFEVRRLDRFATGSQRRECRTTIKCRHAFQPGAHSFGIGLQPGLRGCVGWLVLVQDRVHHLVFAAQRELQVLSNRPMLGHSWT